MGCNCRQLCPVCKRNILRSGQPSVDEQGRPVIICECGVKRLGAVPGKYAQPTWVRPTPPAVAIKGRSTW